MEGRGAATHGGGRRIKGIRVRVWVRVRMMEKKGRREERDKKAKRSHQSLEHAWFKSEVSRKEGRYGKGHEVWG